MKNLLIINGNPDKESYSSALTDAYLQGASRNDGLKVDVLNVIDLNFDPVLKFGYKKRTVLEPDLERALELIKKAHHTVWIFPTWWGGVPAILKGFIDRLFLPGHLFKYHKKGPFWDKLMKGKTARIITTMDAPVWYYYLIYGSPGHKSMKGLTLDFVGFKTKITSIGNMKHSKEKYKVKWIEKIKKLGFKENRS